MISAMARRCASLSGVAEILKENGVAPGRWRADRELFWRSPLPLAGEQLEPAGGADEPFFFLCGWSSTTLLLGRIHGLLCEMLPSFSKTLTPGPVSTTWAGTSSTDRRLF